MTDGAATTTAAARVPVAVLRRVLAAPPRELRVPGCEMCGAPYGETHSHVVAVDTRELMCTCRPCALLFTSDGAAGGHYRAVPERYLSFDSFALTAAQWDDLQIPVGMAFLFHNSTLGRVVAFYPSPAGATESELALDAWSDLVAANPALDTVAADVEALLIRLVDGRVRAHLVPIDRCYELVGHLRQHWRGFDGGTEAHQHIDAFFAEIVSRSRPAS
ncbi:MAG: DUF5947 family protein [Sporichthyaceae bacterium]